MTQVRSANERGSTSTDWLRSFHSFSFNRYHDPAHTHFGALRVLNDDFVAGGGGFPMHGHRDMEIITYVTNGALEHRDSTGGHGVIRAGEMQRMVAGRGIMHSEFNASDSEELRLLQIWIHPRELGAEPGYEQRTLPVDERRNVLFEAVSDFGGAGVLHIDQDVRLFLSTLDEGARVSHTLAAGRGAYLFVIDGGVHAGGHDLGRGDALLLREEPALLIEAASASEVLLFDLPV